MRFYIKLIKNLILKNKGKLFLIITILVSGLVIFNIDMQYKKYDTIITYQNEGKYYSVYEDGGDQKVYEVSHPDMCYVKVNKPGLHIGFGITFVASILIFISITLNNDKSDTGWEYRWCKALAYYDLVESFFENDTYYYRLNNRLLLKSDHRCREGVIHEEIFDYIKDPKSFPVYDGPRSLRRGLKLDSILK